MWVVVALETDMGWPTSQTAIPFEGHEMLLRPASERLLPSVAMAYEPPMTHETALLLVRRFLSSLAWVESAAVREAFDTGGSMPIQVGRTSPGTSINPRFRLDYLPAPNEPKARLALALYREGLGLNSRPYKLLSFYKIINLLHGRAEEQQAWINATVDRLEDNEAFERIAALRAAGETDIGKYLYVSGRCAVAHAYGEPTVDPDDPEHMVRVSRDLRVVQALAEYLIDHELGVLSLHTVWKQHLYELEGFRTILGPTIVSILKRKGALRVVPTFPALSLRVRYHPTLASFERMTADIQRSDAGRLDVACTSATGGLRALLTLDFSDEHLRFDPARGVLVRDDGSAAAARSLLDRILFVQWLFQNGQLEVWDADHDALLGRCATFIPANIDLGATIDSMEPATRELEAEVRRRELADA